MPASEARIHLFHLRRRFRQQQLLRRTLLEPAMWVDFALLALIFFILQSAFVVQPGIVVDLPTAPMAGGAPYGSLVVTLSQEGLLFFDDQRMTVDAFADALARAARREPGATLVIEADARARHSELVRIYDLATRAGVKQVVLATRVSARGTAPP
jgi:biopolymer transport protein ExbD